MINIKEPFWSAGQKYHWPGSRTGVGIKAIELDGEGELEITIADKPDVYTISKEKARNLFMNYKSEFITKGTKLAVLPLEEFNKK